MRCPQCDSEFAADTGRVNRAKKIGAPLYCGRACAGLARRLKTPPTDAEKRAAKAEYDRLYRERTAEARIAQKRAYYEANRDRLLARMVEYRKKRMPAHVEYCRRPEYRAWKSEYDKQYRAKREFGPFADAALLLQEIGREVDARATRYEVYLANGTINKALMRRRSL